MFVLQLKVHESCFSTANATFSCHETGLASFPQERDASVNNVNMPAMKVANMNKHHFVASTFSRPASCKYCNKNLPGLYKQGM